MIQISEAELKVMDGLCKGLLYKEIANEKNISINTVKKHLKNIYKKLDAKDRKDACEKFFQFRNSNQ